MPQKQVNTNRWRWSRDSFIEPEKLGLTIPSYYDAPIVDSSDIQNGILTDTALSFVGNNDVFAVTGGKYYAGKTTRTAWPSEAISMIFPSTGTIMNITSYPGNSMMPTLATYGLNSDNVFVPKTIYTYSPGSMFASAQSTDNVFKINPTPSVEVKASPTKSFSNVSVSLHTTLVSGDNVFVLPESPVVNLVINTVLIDSLVDYERGIIYTTDAVTNISVNFDTVPLFSYLPKDASSNNLIIDAPSFSTGNFSSINVTPEFYR